MGTANQLQAVSSFDKFCIALYCIDAPCINPSISPAAGPTAANPLHAAAVVDRWDRDGEDT